jgi:hypothetical protein
MAQLHFYFLVYKCPRCSQRHTCNMCSNNSELPGSVIKEIVDRVGMYCKTFDCAWRCGAAELQVMDRSLNRWVS